MYGTWKRLNAVAVIRKARKTHSADKPVGVPGGTAKVSRKNTGSATAPTSIIARREPRALSIRSLRAPITGSTMTSQILATVTTAPATNAATPSDSVR